jgi:hypothetical protein
MKSAMGILIAVGALLASPGLLAGDEKKAASVGETPKPAVAESAAAKGAPAMIVARDPVTGQLRAPTAEERRALIESARRSLAFVAEPTLVETLPDGSKHARLGPEFFRWSVVRKSPDGTLTFDCLPTSAAPAALAGSPAPARVAK